MNAAVGSHRFVMRFALAGVQVFAWIFIFQYFSVVSGASPLALAHVALLYALSQVVSSLATPYVARILRHGVIRALVFGIFAAAAAFVVLGATFEGFWQYSVGGVISFALLLGLYRALYFVPYELEAGGIHSRSTLREVAVAFAPLVAGLILVTNPQAPIWVLYGCAGLIVLSAVFLYGSRESYERFSWGYRETFANLMARENRRVAERCILEGITGAALLFLWPIAVFLIIGQSYGLLGVVLTITFLMAILARGIVRRGLQINALRGSALINALLIVSPWLMRLAVATPLGVVFVDSFFYTTTPRRFGMDPLVFEQASDGGSYLDEYTAIKEIALSIGRIALCALAAALALAISLPAAFVGAFALAAIASLAAARLTR